jgi:hypothetical protein
MRFVKKKVRTLAEIEKDIELQSKVCGKCLERKPFDFFSKCTAAKDGRTSKCKSCESIYNAREKTPEQKLATKERLKKKNIEKNYGISIEEYRRCMETSSCCEICGVKGKLVYDHCHVTGDFRGVLCHNCNLAIGKLGDNLEGISKAYYYLKEKEGKDGKI